MPSEADQLAELARMTSPSAHSDDAEKPSTAWNYFNATRTATYGFFAALPLLILYEVGILFANSGQMLSIEVGSAIWMKRLLAWFGGSGWMALGIAVFIIGAVIYWSEKNKPPLKARYFWLIIGESLIYAAVLAFLVGGVVGLLFNAWIAPDMMVQHVQEVGMMHKLALSIGAGLYEELVFRVILVGGLFLLINKLVHKRAAAYIIAALIGAFLFSLVHYTGSMGDTFTYSSFTFRFLFGLALNVVFLARGFAVAAWAHALYDVLVVTGGLW